MSNQPLAGIKIIDFTHVQAGPACTQLLAWFGADVIKVERPGSGDVTRTQLRDIPDVDALYFTMLNSNKRSLTLDTKKPEGKAVLEKLIKESDVLVENFGPGALDRMGFTWEYIQTLNPKLIVASVKGFSDGHHYDDLKVYENVAQCAGGAASTTGFWDGPPTVSAAALGDSNTGMHLAIGILTAVIGRMQTGKGQKVAVSMQDSVLNLCRVKLRDQQRLDRLGFLEEYPQYPHGTFSDVVPRGGNAGGGGQPGWVLKCKGWETDPNAYIYFITQAAVWPAVCKVIGEERWIQDEAYRTPAARLLHQKLARVTDRFLDVALEFMGMVPHDERLKQAIRRQSAVVDLWPSSRSGQAFKQLAGAVDTWGEPERLGLDRIAFFSRQAAAATGW